jgi:hypothetical protein
MRYRAGSNAQVCWKKLFETCFHGNMQHLVRDNIASHLTQPGTRQPTTAWSYLFIGHRNVVCPHDAPPALFSGYKVTD